MTDDEKTRALYQFVVKRVNRWALPNGAGATRPMQILNTYGYCNCSGFGSTLATLASHAGLKSRNVGIGGHSVTEIYYDDGWHLFDANMSGTYPKDDGTLASAEEVHQNLDLLGRATDHRFWTPDNYGPEQLRRMYSRGKFGHSAPRKAG